MHNKISLLALIGVLLVYEPIVRKDETITIWSFERAELADCRVSGQALLSTGAVAIRGMLPCTATKDGMPLPGAAP